MSARVSDRARALLEHLEPGLARYLGGLIEADSRAHRYAEVEARAELAEDMVAELRRVVDSRTRQLDRVKAEMQRLGQLQGRREGAQ